jgi:MoxR-like ATPase
MAGVTEKQAAWFEDAFVKLVDNVGHAILGKQHVIRLVITTMLSGGHLLLEDVPGTGKTVLAKSLANTLKGTNSRIQFTPDLLPTDVTGITIYDQGKKVFEFHKGPIFASVVLADEINRASPKTQSALLEVMEEGFVTVDGVAHAVPQPFMVIATQNPVEQAGTYRLPEAQLDRFLMKTALGYPDRKIAADLLGEASNRARAALVTAVIDPESVITMTKLAEGVFVDPAISEYIIDIVEATRDDADIALGVSTRGAMNMVRAIKTWAIAAGRTYVTPDDVRDLAIPVLAHRIMVNPDSEFAGMTAEQIIDRIVEGIAPPAYRTA